VRRKPVTSGANWAVPKVLNREWQAGTSRVVLLLPVGLLIRAPAGQVGMSTDFLVRRARCDDAGGGAASTGRASSRCPYCLLGSRYCETDRLSNTAWSLFGQILKGWPLVTAIRDYVHYRITFGYQHASSSKTAWDAHSRRSVCRDFADLAITLCRCMNIPARFAPAIWTTLGYYPTSPMDFSAWFEFYLGDRWYTLDTRHNKPRVGRILMARGRDATDVAIVASFGPCTLTKFKVFTDEVT
jgi:transglutaminase-like putative cysteine protease